MCQAPSQVKRKSPLSLPRGGDILVGIERQETINPMTKWVNDRILLKGDLHYEKENGKTEQVREMGDAGVGTLLQFE